MKTDLLVLAGTVLLFASLPMVSHADEDDGWAAASPLAMGEPMMDCDVAHPDIAIAIEPVPPLASEKVEAILATPDVAPANGPTAPPAVIMPAVAPVIAPAKTPAESTTQASPPRPLSTAALLTFALIASPGTALPQTGSGSRD